MSGTIGNNLLELEFPTAEEAAGGRQQFLMGLRESALKNDDLMDAFYDLVIDSYDYVGNYLVLVFRDAYDVMTKTSVGAPDTGFVFPAFTGRSTDIHSVMFYTRDTKTPHSEFMESGLGCGSKFTATEQKLTFQSIVKEVIGEDDDESDAIFMDIQDNLNDLIPVALEDEPEPEPVPVKKSTISSVLAESGVTEEQAAVIEQT